MNIIIHPWSLNVLFKGNHQKIRDLFFEKYNLVVEKIKTKNFQNYNNLCIFKFGETKPRWWFHPTEYDYYDYNLIDSVKVTFPKKIEILKHNIETLERRKVNERDK